jgi:hypothetical protein
MSFNSYIRTIVVLMFFFQRYKYFQFLFVDFQISSEVNVTTLAVNFLSFTEIEIKFTFCAFAILFCFGNGGLRMSCMYLRNF